MIEIVKEYPYTTATRIDSPEGRQYVFSDGIPVPSVTTILSKTKVDVGLLAWRQRVGEEEADRITKQAAHIGTHMHDNLEKYVLGNGKPYTGPLISKILCKLIIKRGLSNVPVVYGTEVPLFVKGLYGGTTDLVAIHGDVISIIDYKNSNKEKQKKWIGDYACQLAAYAIAHNDMYGTNIRRGVVMVGVRDPLRYQEFVFEGNEYNIAKEEWLNRVDKYYTQLNR